MPRRSAGPTISAHIGVGHRQGQHSIRINDQYRICFVWRDGDAHQVEVVDYH
jgi:plasmid maintenance system killer protein